MNRVYMPKQTDPAPVWAPWVARGITADERRLRLEQVPESMRKRVEDHVRSVFELKAAQKRRNAIIGV